MKPYLLPLVPLLALFPSFHAKADTLLDSLRRELRNAHHDTSRVRLYVSMAYRYGWNSSDSSIFYANRALDLSKKLSYSHGLYHGHHLLANACFITGEFAKGMTEEKKALAVARLVKNDEWEYRSINSLGLLYLQADKFKDAIPLFYELIGRAEKNSDGRSLGSAYNNLANCYLKLGNYDESLKWRKKAITIRLKRNVPNELADSYNDLGETYLQLDLPDSAVFYFKKCLEIKENIGDEEMCALSTLNLGATYLKLGDYRKAKDYLARSMHWTNRINSNLYRIEILKYQAEIAGKENDHAQEAGILKQLLLFKDSVYNEENRRQMNQLHAEFESERKELQIKALETEKYAEESRGRIILTVSVAGLVLLSVFLLIVFNRFRVTRRQKSEIENQKILVEEKQKEILDSIHYAKRIQNSLMPTEKYIHSKIPSKK
ncbi:MAG: tetratricopeptide repeat protein [Bacteroidia bacterium]|nr:tetratricopeptide repeat protein [Bacteroidia bacterium]